MNAPPVLHTATDLDSPVDIAYDVIRTGLDAGEIETIHGLMYRGSNHTFLVTVEHEATCFLAVYKPCEGERPLWDFPDGTLCRRETAASVLSDMLGWYLVPPTVLREGPHGIGSVQAFIEHDPQQHYFTFEDTVSDFEAIVPQLQRMAAFDVIANNADRKGGHCLVDADAHLWGIDHGLTFHPMNKLRTVIWDYAGMPLPDAICRDLEALCATLQDDDNANRKLLATLLAEREIRALENRLQRLLDDGTYPQPGPGPNRPWPAV